MRILSRKNRKQQHKLEVALASHDVLPEHIRRLAENISLLNYDIMDTIVNEKLHREGQTAKKSSLTLSTSTATLRGFLNKSRQSACYLDLTMRYARTLNR